MSKLRVLLVEPDYHRDSSSFIAKRLGESPSKKIDDESLWYPPLGLMKLATFHKRRGDEVVFTRGYNKNLAPLQPELFSPDLLWDRVYIATLFTFDWKKTVETIHAYREALGQTSKKIFVGGIMASIMPDELDEETEIYPVTGIIYSPAQIKLEGKENIDLLPPDYDLVEKELYAINDTYYGYTTRGCTNKCVWCGVPSIEPTYCDYIDIKPAILELREKHGDKAKLKLMDNNILASPQLEKIVNDLLELGYGKGEQTKTQPKKLRTVDFNQGLDATHFTEESIALLSKLHIRPMRVAFDRIQEKDVYENALRLAHRYGFREFSNYMLFACKDTPRDLFERLEVNINLNDEWAKEGGSGKSSGAIYSYPMRFAPIKATKTSSENRQRDIAITKPEKKIDFLNEAVWTKRFMRNIEIMKGVAHGMISPTVSLARRAIGHNYKEFIANLYMPEELLRNRNKYERKRYDNDKDRPEGTGDIEDFRLFIYRLLENQDGDEFLEFHNAVSECSKTHTRKAIENCKADEVKKWLKYYL